MLKPALQVLPPCIRLSQRMGSGKPFGFQGETPNSTNLIWTVGRQQKLYSSCNSRVQQGADEE